MKLPFVTLNHYTPSGFQTQDVVLKEDAEKLEAENKRLKDIISLAYSGIREIKSQYIFCDCSDDPQDDMCMHCILQNIMLDIEQGKTETLEE